MSVQGIFQRKEAPYDTDCFPSWSQTNYSEPFLGTKIWPYSFMVSAFAQDNILAPTGSLEVINQYIISIYYKIRFVSFL